MDRLSVPPAAASKIKRFNNKRLALLSAITLDDLIANRSCFLRSGEITNASELAYHLLAEYFDERQDPLRDKLLQKLEMLFPSLGKRELALYIVRESAEFEEEYTCKLNALTKEFLEKYCSNLGRISWEKFA